MVTQQYNELMREKARVNWVKEGGANNAFFHANIKIRKAHNTIFELETTEGNLVIGQD